MAQRLGSLTPRRQHYSDDAVKAFLDQGFSQNYIKKHFGVGFDRIARIKKGFPAIPNHRPKKFEKRHEDYIESLVYNNPRITLQEIKQKFEENFSDENLSISHPTISSILKQRSYSYTIPIKIQKLNDRQ